MGYRYNSPPNWPAPPQGWTPPPGWTSDPAWGPAPEGWEFWVPDESAPTAAYQGHAETTGRPNKDAWRKALPAAAVALVVLSTLRTVVGTMESAEAIGASVAHSGIAYLATALIARASRSRWGPGLYAGVTLAAIVLQTALMTAGSASR